MKKILSPVAFCATIMAAFAAQAEAAYEGMAHNWQLGMQTPASPVMEQLYEKHNFLLWIISIITLFVLVVMTYICLRFNRKANPVPSKTTHHTMLEVIWTAIPILILVVIAIPSLRLHYYMERLTDPGMTLKVVGYQWYWHYDYPDQGGFGYDSYIKKGADLKPGDVRQLAVDNPVVVPVNTKVRVIMTGADVIHSWAVPAFGMKRDAVPGRLNETWFEANKIGTFYGQCSQLCGVGHGFMPIEVKVVSKEDFDAWVKAKQTEAGITAPAAAPAQKTTAPLAAPASAEHASPHPVIEKEKKESKPAASDNNPEHDKKDASSVTTEKGNQPEPAKAAGDKDEDEPAGPSDTKSDE